MCIRDRSTGHAPPPQAMGYGAVPQHVILTPGDATFEELINMVEHGLLITSFHYINPYLHPKTALMTGMTRHGTFLIENGKITKPVKNLRFTESILKAFKNVEKLTKDCEIYSTPFSFIKVPALLIRKFTFTGKTQF